MNNILEKQDVRINNISIPCLVFQTIGESGNVIYWYKANDIALFVGYKNPTAAVKRNVDSRYKKKFLELIDIYVEDNNNSREKYNIHPHTMFISETGIYDLIIFLDI